MMKRFPNLATALLLLALTAIAACGHDATRTAQESVYRGHAALNVALIAAIQYAKLPRCPAAKICSEQDIVEKMLAAEEVAATALDNAERIARDPKATKDAVSAALAAADGAMSTFDSLTRNLPKLKE